MGQAPHQLTPDNEINFYHRSITDSRGFWTQMCHDIGVEFRDVYQPTPETIVDATDPKHPEWFKGAQINIVDTMLKKAKTDPEAIAYVYKNERTGLEGPIERYTYKQLDEMSSRFANALRAKGVQQGESIVFCTSAMNPESVAAYLGCMKAGVTMVSIRSDNSIEEMRARVNVLPPELKPKLMLTQDYENKADPLTPDGKASMTSDGKRQRNPSLYAGRARKIADELGIESVVIKEKQTGETFPDVALFPGDENYEDFTKSAPSEFQSVPLAADAPVIVLYSSGTTGMPKAIPWRADCFIKSAADGRNLHGMKDGETLCWPSNFGWMMGSYDMASALMNGGTLAVYENNPMTRGFGEFVQNAGVSSLGTVPPYTHAWFAKGLMQGLDFSKVHHFMNTAAPSNPEEMEHMLKQVFTHASQAEYSGGTDAAGGINANTPFAHAAASQFNYMAPGTKGYVKLDPEDPTRALLYIVVANKDGYVTPMGLSSVLYGQDHDTAYKLSEIEPGVWARKWGDAFRVPEGFKEGYIEVTPELSFKSVGRDDDIINFKGVKASRQEITEALLKGLHDDALGYGALVGNIAVCQLSPEQGEKVVAHLVFHDQVPAVERERLLKSGELVRSLNAALAKYASSDRFSLDATVEATALGAKVPLKGLITSATEQLAARAGRGPAGG